MGLPELVISLLQNVVEPIAGPFRMTIQLSKVTGRNAYGPTYGPEEPIQAVVEAVSQTVTSADGTEKTSADKLTFLGPIDIDEGDRVKINGVQKTIIKVGGPLRPDGQPYAPEAWTGR